MSTFDRVFGEEGNVLGERNFQLLLVANVVYPYGTTFISPLLESLVGPFGTTPGRIGLMLTAFYVPAIVVTPIIGLLTDKYGRKPLLVTGLTLFGAAGVLIATTTDYRAVLTLRLVQGLGAAGILPVVVTSIGDLYTDTREITAQGLRTSFHSLSAATAPLVAGAVFLVGWQYPFLVYGVALVFAAALLLWFEEPKEAIDAPTTDDLSGGLRNLFSRPAVSVTILGLCVPSAIFVSFLTYASFIVVRGTGGTAQYAGVLVSVATAASAIASSQSGRLTETTNGKTLPLSAGNAAMGLGLVAVALAPSFAVAVGGTVALGFGFGVLLTLYRSLLTTVGPEPLRGTVVSVGEGVRTFGAAITPLLTGIAIAYAQPMVGVLDAVRATNVAVGLLGAAVGIACVLMIRDVNPAS